MQSNNNFSIIGVAGDYLLHKKLGKGGQATVYLATKNNQSFAIKVYSSEISKEKAFRDEVGYLTIMNSPFVIKMVDYHPTAIFQVDNSVEERRPIIVLELAQGGELFQYLKKQGRFPSEVCRRYTKQLVQAIKVLRGQNIAHRDIKPQNILFDDHFNLKLTDFGLACNSKGSLGNNFMLENRGEGTQGYKSPQMEEGRPYNGFQTDMFTVGINLFIMYSGFPPFKSATSTDKYYRHIKDRNFKRFWEMHQQRKSFGFFETSFKRLINSFFSVDPQRRPTFLTLEEDDWWNGRDISHEELEEYMKPKHDMLMGKSELEMVKLLKVEGEQDTL